MERGSRLGVFGSSSRYGGGSLGMANPGFLVGLGGGFFKEDEVRVGNWGTGLGAGPSAGEASAGDARAGEARDEAGEACGGGDWASVAWGGGGGEFVGP